MKKLKIILRTFLKKLANIPNLVCIVIILIYRAIFSPSVGILRFLPFYPRPSCVFYPTCSEYSITVFKKHHFLKAFSKVLRRITRCHPGTPPQVDLP